MQLDKVFIFAQLLDTPRYQYSHCEGPPAYFQAVNCSFALLYAHIVLRFLQVTTIVAQAAMVPIDDSNNSNERQLIACLNKAFLARHIPAAGFAGKPSPSVTQLHSKGPRYNLCDRIPPCHTLNALHVHKSLHTDERCIAKLDIHHLLLIVVEGMTYMNKSHATSRHPTGLQTMVHELDCASKLTYIITLNCSRLLA